MFVNNNVGVNHWDYYSDFKNDFTGIYLLLRVTYVIFYV